MIRVAESAEGYGAPAKSFEELFDRLVDHREDYVKIEIYDGSNLRQKLAFSLKDCFLKLNPDDCISIFGPQREFRIGDYEDVRISVARENQWLIIQDSVISSTEADEEDRSEPLYEEDQFDFLYEEAQERVLEHRSRRPRIGFLTS